MKRWYWYRGRIYRRRWCSCEHEDLLHMGLTSRCLAPVSDGGPGLSPLCGCSGFRLR